MDDLPCLLQGDSVALIDGELMLVGLVKFD
jgi:hypothetical protein